MITDTEIRECGWEPEIVSIDIQNLDAIPEKVYGTQDGDILIDGWTIYKDENLWWEMCRNDRRLMIIKKWYTNEIGQEWNMIMDVPISDKQELLTEMSWIGIPVKELDNAEQNQQTSEDGKDVE